MAQSIVLGGNGDQRVELPLGMAARHGLIAGATGTGKTVTLQVMAEGFARRGVPVFAVDAKGDLSGVAAAGGPHPEIDRRKALIGLDDHQLRGCPTLLWDVFGERGHPVRTTVSDMGPDILSTLLDLNETQTGIMYACFAVADDEGLLLLDLKDLRSLLAFMSANAATLRERYGNISAASVGAIQRRLLVLEQQGVDRFFGEPALALADLMQRDFSGHGVISLLDGEKLLRESPALYTACMLWLLSELFEELPEAGDLDAPRLVLFIDEAHLLFSNLPRQLEDRISQVFRLIRSKGVGIFLVTQSPKDVPEAVLGQLGTRVQHALRAYTPRDQALIRSIAAGMRNDHGLDLPRVVQDLGVGEALVSVLDDDGVPTSVAAVTVAPPESRIGPLADAERETRRRQSPMAGRYDHPVDRESAFELLRERAEQAAALAERAAEEKAAADREARDKAADARRAPRQRASNRQSMAEAFMKSTLRSVGRSLGSRLVRGLLGSLVK
ncbi:MAG: ATP-binding protein [Gammaproteobacteria bacterium]|nr:ATP-binding protein [Gammaproteobacteria bacterium]